MSLCFSSEKWAHEVSGADGKPRPCTVPGPAVPLPCFLEPLQGVALLINPEHGLILGNGRGRGAGRCCPAPASGAKPAASTHLAPQTALQAQAGAVDAQHLTAVDLSP